MKPQEFKAVNSDTFTMEIIPFNMMQTHNAILHFLSNELSTALTKINMTLIMITPATPAAATPSINQKTPFALPPPSVTARPIDCG